MDLCMKFTVCKNNADSNISKDMFDFDMLDTVIRKYRICFSNSDYTLMTALTELNTRTHKHMNSVKY